MSVRVTFFEIFLRENAVDSTGNIMAHFLKPILTYMEVRGVRSEQLEKKKFSN